MTAFITSMRTSPSWPNHLPMSPLTKSPDWRLGLNIEILEETETFQSLKNRQFYYTPQHHHPLPRSPHVLLYSGCHKKMLNRNKFLTGLEAGKCVTRTLIKLSSGESSLPARWLLVLTLSSQEKRTSSLLSLKGTTPIMGASPWLPNFNLILFQRPHLQILLHWDFNA